MSNHRKAQAIINKKFPELMELKKYCQLKSKFTNEYSEIVGQNPDGTFAVSDGNWFDNQSYELIRLNYEALGQPITLQSLLRHLAQFSTRTRYREFVEKYLFFNKNIELEIDTPIEKWGEKKWGEILKLLEE